MVSGSKMQDDFTFLDKKGSRKCLKAMFEYQALRMKVTHDILLRKAQTIFNKIIHELKTDTNR